MDRNSAITAVLLADIASQGELYERLIDDCIVAADGLGSTVDHLTARRRAARPQEQVFAQGWPASPRPARSARR